MTFFHLSDLHLGLKLINHDLLEDQKYILEKIINYTKKHKPDAILIAGDIYDKAIPPIEAVELFDDFIRKLTEAAPDAEIMLISGNHDSAPRVNIFRNILKRQKIHMIGTPPVTPEDHIEKVTLEDSFGPEYLSRMSRALELTVSGITQSSDPADLARAAYYRDALEELRSLQQQSCGALPDSPE